MINKIKIAVVTGLERLWILKPILKIINKDPVFELQLVVGFTLIKILVIH